ncbi:MAG: amidohydrolase [Bacteroidota bacterium]
MRLILPMLGLMLCCSSLCLAQKAFDKQQKEVLQALDSKTEIYGDLAHQIWNLAELGYQEEKSITLLQAQLKEAGFNLEQGVAEIPTAFVASYGSGEPVIGLLAEYDALPGFSQEALPTKQAKEGLSTGHACGHHLFGSGSVAAAIEVKNWLERTGTSGTVRLYGTPAEEGGAGKVYMVRAGLFDDVDAVIHWHPGSGNSASAASSLANKSAKFRFYGQASHAAVAPERGRSALDGVEALNYMVNMMREHVPMESRIHYVITRGGEAPNVVPAYAEVFYYVRHPKMRMVRSIFDRVVKAAEGAALGTGTQLEYEVIHGVYNLLPNRTLAEKMHHNLERVGGVEYTAEERAFAEEIISSYPDSEVTPEMASEVGEFRVIEFGAGGSTDVGDVSWAVPTVGLRTATWVPGTPPHSWQAVAAGGMSIGTKGMMVAAKTMALTAMDLFKDPSICAEALEELKKRRGPAYKYEALLGDRTPPLDYRK